MKKLRGGRFGKDMTREVEAFTESISTDARMIAEDIWGSQAHALMLAACGLLSEEDLRQILTWLQKAEEDFEAGRLQLKPELEDVHMNVEAYLLEGAGREYGGKLHTGRSRNDQVATDTRLRVRAEVLATQNLILELVAVLLTLAERHAGALLPGFTHVQHAQPVTVGFWLSAYASMFLRDFDRLADAYCRINLCPLGAAALAGTSYPIDRELSARLLGFDRAMPHALDAVSSRDFAVETLAALAICASNMSRLAEEIVYWSTPEFGMVTLDDSYALGSSIMPQKKNPCVAELIRSRTGRSYGALMQLLTVLKGIPMGYNRDLQEDRPPLWEALDTVQASLRILRSMMETTQLNLSRMEGLSDADFAAATEMANFLVRERGLPFRTCHEVVGGLVSRLIAAGKAFADTAVVQSFLADAGLTVSEEELRRTLDPKEIIKSYCSLGSASPEEVCKTVASLQTEAELRRNLLSQREAAVQDARNQTRQLCRAVVEGRSWSLERGAP